MLQSGESLAETARWARRPWDRTRGLLGRPRLSRGQALVIERGSQVHTFGLRYPIDVLFCDQSWVIRHVVRCMRPRRVTGWVLGARYVVEFPCGTLPGGLQPGDELVVETNAPDVPGDAAGG